MDSVGYVERKKDRVKNSGKRIGQCEKCRKRDGGDM
jgi:hypothetical protein